MVPVTVKCSTSRLAASNVYTLQRHCLYLLTVNIYQTEIHQALLNVSTITDIKNCASKSWWMKVHKCLSCTRSEPWTRKCCTQVATQQGNFPSDGDSAYIEVLQVGLWTWGWVKPRFGLDSVLLPSWAWVALSLRSRRVKFRAELLAHFKVKIALNWPKTPKIGQF